ncbi:hypothetical protein LL946_06360 [Knoellia locipacati]|uniref:hypothetical protein n=1 Tax=Knoellia locipacati TaxID=882824 RepID=UPI00384B4817
MDGEWSFRQVYTEARVPEGVAKGLAERGYLHREGLFQGDVVVLKVAAALESAATLFEPRRKSGRVLSGRDKTALQLTRVALGDPWLDAAATLVVRGDLVALTRNAIEAVQEAASPSREIRLLLPVGAWIEELPTRRAWLDFQRAYAVPPLRHGGSG